jgi:dienelactone hydrolase
MKPRTALRSLVALAILLVATTASFPALGASQIPSPSRRRESPPPPADEPVKQDPERGEEPVDVDAPDEQSPDDRRSDDPAAEPADAPQTPAVTGPIAPIEEPSGTRDGGLTRKIRLGLTVADDAAGVVIQAVAPRSAAATAGLREGDLLVRANAADITSATVFADRLAFMHAGEPVTLTVVREGAPLDVLVVPEEAVREGDLEARVEYGAFTSGKARLRSIWSVPSRAGSAPYPAVLVIRGVGASAADAPGNNPYREIAFRLARAGIITVRYDPQGVGDSDGAANTAVDFLGEVEDARAALAHLRADPRVDPTRIVVLGHGTGGGAAAVVARSDARLAGLAVLGTIARPLREYVLDSRRQQLALAGVAPGDVDDMLREHVEVFAGVLAEGRVSVEDSFGIVAEDGTVMGKSAKYWRQYDQVNFGRLFSKLEMPVLNAIGEYDFVSTLADHRAIADALRAKGQPGPVIVLLDRVDHDLRSYDSREAAFASFGSTDAPVSDAALTRIVDWVRSTTAPSQAHDRP